MQTKTELRREMRARREAMPEPERLIKSAAIRARLIKFCLDRHLSRIGLFAPFRGELDLMPMVTARPDWVWCFPRVLTNQPPRLIWGRPPLEPGRFGILEPTRAQDAMPPVQVLLIPCLAFDQNGYRLGYGGGFYDALLERLPGDVLTLAVAFGCQEVPHLPREPHDQPVQGVFTESGLRGLDEE